MDTDRAAADLFAGADHAASSVGELTVTDDHNGGSLFGFDNADGNSWVVRRSGRAEPPLILGRLAHFRANSTAAQPFYV